MVNGEVNQTQFLQNPLISKANSDNVSRKKSLDVQGEDFKKVLSTKKEERKSSGESTIDSKDSNVIEKDKATKSKTIQESDNKDKSNNVEEEKLNQLNTIIQDLIQTLQLNNIIDEDKLASLIKEFENITSGLDADSVKLNISSNLDILKDLLGKLESISSLELASNESLNAVIKDKLEQVSQLVKSIDSSFSFESKGSNESTSSNGSTVLNSSNGDIVDNVEAKADFDNEISSEKKHNTKNSEPKISLQSNEKAGSDLPLKKSIVSDSRSALFKDIDVADVKNIQVDNINNLETFEANKTLTNSALKPDMNIFNQIIEGAKVTVSEDVSEMLLKLKPDNLGKLTMKIVVERGMLVARFDVESQMVKEAIESNLEDLRNALSDKGFEIQEFNVSVNKDSDNQESSFSYFNKRKTKTLLNDSQEKNNTYISNLQSIDSLSSSINYLG